MVLKSWPLIGFIFAAWLGIVTGRQMCYSCAYSSNPQNLSIECVTAPQNWTGGPPEARCPNNCWIRSIWDIKTKTATFMYRGCSDTFGKNTCVKSDTQEDCNWYCKDVNFCNDGTGNDRIASASHRLTSGPSLFAGLGVILMYFKSVVL